MKTWNQMWKAFGLMAMLSAAPAFAVGEECTGDQDCGAGTHCVREPCLSTPPCDPDDETCVEAPTCGEPVGRCVEGSSDVPSGGCTTDADCGQGLLCTVIATGASSGACPPCAAGEECDCSSDPISEPEEYKGCTPAPCKADTDCKDGMVCETYEVSCASTDVACEKGSECPEPAPCESESYSQCQPKWMGDCEADADCGEGFTCEEEVYTECSGGGGTSSGSDDPGSGGATPTPGAEPQEADAGSSEGERAAVPSKDGTEECVEKSSGHKYCKAQEKACEADADCPADWKCEATYTNVSTGEARPECTPGGECGGDSDADAGSSGAPLPVAPPEEDKLCVPPYYSDWQSAGALPPSAEGAMGEASTTGIPKGGVDEDGGADGSDGNSESLDPNTTGSAGANSSSGTAAGCAVQATESSSGGAFALVGLLALLGLRRSVRA